MYAPAHLNCNNRSTEKDTEKYIADDEAVRSNIKLLTNILIEDKRPRLREADSLSLESFHKNIVLTLVDGCDMKVYERSL